jgi:riboflavin synthase
MFTGIIEGSGTLLAIKQSQAGRQMGIEADFPLEGTKIGASIAVDGACLTVVHIDKRRFDVDISPETVIKTTLGSLTVGDRVNLERALRLGDRLDGHLVSGHVDGVAKIRGTKRRANTVIVSIEVPRELSRYLIEKGSIAVDGTSLTINRVTGALFEVSIIPHTADVATIATKPVGSRVNVETDMIGKYVQRFVFPGSKTESKDDSNPSSVDMDLLLRTGFIK